jgi:hypothetical protein
MLMSVLLLYKLCSILNYLILENITKNYLNSLFGRSHFILLELEV